MYKFSENYVTVDAARYREISDKKDPSSGLETTEVNAPSIASINLKILLSI